MVDISKLGINPLAFDETIGSTLNDPLPLDAPQQQAIGSPADVLPEERASKFANFVESIATGPEVPGFSLLGALSKAFGQSTQEIENRRRLTRRRTLEDQIFEKQAAEVLAAPAATAKRDILKDVGGRQRFVDTGELAFPGAEVPSEDEFINIQGGKALFQTSGGQVEARDIKGLSTSDLESAKVVQSSKILPGGVTQITFKDGSIEVRKVSGDQLRMVKDAEQRGVTLAQASSAARVTGGGESRRTQKTINEGVEAVQGLPILRRGLQLLERVETGGIDAVRLRAKQLFGIEGADEGELSANLGRAVLGQLRETFGAAFTEREGARLEQMSAGFGKSLVSNKRLLRQALVLIQGASDRGLKAAGRVGDESAIEQLLDFQEGRFDLTDEALSSVFNPIETPPDELPTDPAQEDVDTGRVTATGGKIFKKADGSLVVRE